MKHRLLALGVGVLVTGHAFAGEGVDLSARAPYPNPRTSGQGRVSFTANNVQLLGWKTLSDFAGGNTSGNDCWGYTSPAGREYAIIGLSNGTGFVEVTDPGNPVIVSFKFHNSAPSLWRCIKVYQNYAYAGSEAGGGIQVFGMSSIDSGVVTASSVVGNSCSAATHTLAVDTTSGFLYRAGGGGVCGPVYQGLQIYSLAAPFSPALVGQWNTGRYVHECQVETWNLPGPYLGKQIAFCFTEDTSGGTNPRLQILDVTNKAAITQIASVNYTGSSFSHQGWLTPSKQNLYLNDELDDGSFGGARTRVFNTANLAAPSYLGFFSYSSVGSQGSIDHNLYTKGNRVYESNYRSGLRVFDNTTPTAPTQIGYFDTWPEDDAQDFNSLWSNYPYFASGTIIGGDIEKGLFVWREGAAKLSFDFPNGIPQFIGPGGGLVQFTVTENAPGDLVAGTVKFHYSTGGAFTSVNATALGGDLFQAVMPAASCGAQLDYYVSGKSIGNVTWTDPPAAPTQVFQATAAYGTVLGHEDTLETDTGWTVNVAADLTGFSTASTGTWTRVNPVGSGAQPEDDHTDAPGTFCWVTGQGVVGGGVGDADVDGGATALRSNAIDASHMADPYVSYWRWFSNFQGSNPGTMTMTVHVSNDGGASWTLLETVGPTGNDTVGGWIKHTARIADFVAPTNDMRLRFRTADTVGAVVEAAVDDLQIFDLICSPVTLSSIAPATGSFNGGEIVTLTGGGFTPTSVVSFGPNVASAVNVLSPTTLLVRVPSAPGPVSGKTGVLQLVVDVTVSNPGAATLPSAYTYLMKQKSL
ncbi:MAG: choice-of-anchor B family protein [Planctomycetes bacterium]|nr:choice-of-anchor B family protein [Planctomycetota bacterium]